jgi:hypothetical protein
MAILMWDSSTVKPARKVVLGVATAQFNVHPRSSIKLDDINKKYVSWSILNKSSNHRGINAQLTLNLCYAPGVVTICTSHHLMWTITMTQYVIRICSTVLFFCNFGLIYHLLSFILLQPCLSWGWNNRLPINFQPPPTDPAKPPPWRRPRFVPVYPAHVLAAVPPPGPPFKRPKWLPLPEQSSQK